MRFLWQLTLELPRSHDDAHALSVVLPSGCNHTDSDNLLLLSWKTACKYRESASLEGRTAISIASPGPIRGLFASVALRPAMGVAVAKMSPRTTEMWPVAVQKLCQCSNIPA